VLSPHFQCVLTRPQRLDELEIRVEARSSLSDQERFTAGAELAHHVKAQIGVSTTVSVVAPGSVERSVGKVRRIVDNR
jgi:phenylacetate-CoA ligase